MALRNTLFGGFFLCSAVLSGCAGNQLPVDAAVRGDPEAQYRVGNAFLTGDGVSRQPKSAFFWWQQAARQGLVPAEYNLAVAYASGSGANRDDESAAIWYRRSAESGFRAAQFNLALLHVVGGGTLRDLGLAVFWYAVAAEDGDPFGAKNLWAVDALQWNPPGPVFLGDQAPAGRRSYSDLPGYVLVY
jgi:TPR repeat protein